MRPHTIVAAIVAALLVASVPALAGPGRQTSGTQVQDRISVVVDGQGPDVILIPGLASSKEVWAGLVAQLKPTHRLHMVQVAGFAGMAAGPNGSGEVAAPVAEAVASYIVHHRLKSPAVIGHSLGGEVALMLGARHPDRVGRLLVVDALPFYSLLLDPTATVEKVEPQARVFRAAMLAAPADQADAMQTAAIARLVKTPVARPALIAAGKRSNKATVANATYELMTTDLRPELGNIVAPVEIVYAYDPIYGVPYANIDALFRRAYANLPGARFRRIDNSFHFVMLDQPKAFADAVGAFLGATTERF